MGMLSYTYRFDDIRRAAGRVELWRPWQVKSQTVQVRVNDDHLLYLAVTNLPPVMADLIDVAVAVQTADRLTAESLNRDVHIHIYLPIRCPEILGSPQIEELLAALLFWYTGWTWTFDFRRRSSVDRPANLQSHLQIDCEQPSEVALWSGGLDAAAGLVSRVLANPDAMASVTLCGTGASTLMQRTQQIVCQHVCWAVPAKLKLIQLPLRLDGLDRLRLNRSMRTRGFVFLLLGAACAVAEGHRRLAIYENGVGAINLPFRRSSIGLIHTRSVHPRSLVQMGELVSFLLGTRFRYENPFLFWTKAQMCLALGEARIADLIPIAISCDSLHRQFPYQCGYCSSCLLRRQALSAAGISDSTDYCLFSKDRRRQRSDVMHLSAMLDQSMELERCLRQEEPWIALENRFEELSHVVPWLEKEGQDAAHVRRSLIALYSRYVQEWQVAREAVGRGLLPSGSHLPAA